MMTHRFSVLMLEDDDDRIERFREVIARDNAFGGVGVAKTAYDFIANLNYADGTDLIALDHDLFPETDDSPDPGDGRDVAEALAKMPPFCPVLIHSTNAPAADSMMFTLRDAGWTADRIAPIGNDWIEAYWYPTVCDILFGRFDRSTPS